MWLYEHGRDRDRAWQEVYAVSREIYCSPRAGLVTMLLDLPPLRTVPSDDVSSFVAGIMT
jgi:hypothetical protein